MNVRQVIEALIGVDPKAEVEVADTVGFATPLISIQVGAYNGSTSVTACVEDGDYVTVARLYDGLWLGFGGYATISLDSILEGSGEIVTKNVRDFCESIAK